MTDRKKPGLAFWASVVLVVVLAYPLSIGPSCWALNLLGNPRWMISLYQRFYSPIIWINKNGPQPIHEAIEWYGDLVPAR